MKIINKTYFLLAILIALASVNLLLLYYTQQEGTDESYTIIRANDLKVKVETVSSFASSIASGNEQDRENLKQETSEIDIVFDALRTGGSLRGQNVVPVPDPIRKDFDGAYDSWLQYKVSAQRIQVEPVFDPQVKNSLNYVLGKNGELLLTTDSVIKELSDLDRQFRRHKEIASELQELANTIGSNTLLISIGEGGDLRDTIHENRIKFEVGLRKLLQIPLDDLDLSGLDIRSEDLEPIPRENSSALRQLDPLWEAIELRLLTIETKTLISTEFGKALSDLSGDRLVLFSSLDNLLDSWNGQIQEKAASRQNIVGGLLVIDVGIFFVVMYTIRHSLSPLSTITSALTRVKEGVYGEKIKYSSKDEVGDLVDTFNIMSTTIREKEEEARKMDQAKDEFLAMITHELKTPLVPIQGYADLLLSGHLGDITGKQKERLEIIKSSSGSLLQLITDLLDAQKLELGQLRMKKEKTNIKTTIEKALETMMPEAKENSIELTHNATKDVSIPHDPERIIQVLTNLIKNSLKAVKPKTGKIEVLVVNSPKAIKIAVKDNGVGVPAELIGKIFRKFYQVDSSLTREKGGSGLGLSICKGIVEGHGGKISAKNNSTGGATFTFTIPANQVEEQS
ncbi:MAG: sensor histidine kinase, partial [Nitrosopumilaceae archaeon]